MAYFFPISHFRNATTYFDKKNTSSTLKVTLRCLIKNKSEKHISNVNEETCKSR